MAGSFASDRVKRLSNLVRTTPPFVGRREELAWLERSMQEALTSQPRVVLLPGEAGIGKTRLLQELRSGALRRGLQVGYGRGYEDLTLPYLPFIEAFHTLLHEVPHDLERLVGNDVEVLRWLLHRDQSLAQVANPFTSTQSDQDKLRLFFAVSHTAIALAQRSPTIIIVDDLHWADRSSIGLFGHLVFTVADLAMREPVPLLIIGSYRPAEAETPLGRLIARLQRELICRTFTLPGLNESEIHELVQGLGLLRPSHQLIATVNVATQGNPLFIQEVLHHLVQQDALQERGGYLVTTNTPVDLRLPDQVTGAIITRTEGLSGACRRVLTLASCLGDCFSLQTLGAMSSLSDDELLKLLEEGMHQGLLLSEGQEFQFAHPLIRHVFYHESSTARRQHIHQQIAQTLQQLYADNIEAHVVEIAHHLVRAGPAADAATVMQYARRAGDQAFKIFAWGEAAHHYETALSAAELNGGLSALDRAELHYRAGVAYFRDQDVGPCVDHYEKAADAYQLAGDIGNLAQALMGKMETQYTLASVPFGTLVDVQPLEDVLKALGESEPRLRGRILAVMAEVYRMARRTDKAEEMGQRALEIGRQLQDDYICSHASFALGLAHIQGLQVREALESWQNALAYARQADDLILQGWPLQRMPLLFIVQGRLDEAQAMARDACDVTRKTQDWAGYSLVLSHLASMAVARGDFNAVEQYAHEAMLMVSRSSYPWGGARALYALACARALRGAWVEAEDALDLLVEPGRVFQEAGPIIQAFARAFRQLLRAYSDNVEEGIEPFAADMMRVAGTDTYSLAPLCALVELGDLMAASTIAELPHKPLLLAAERGVLFSSGWMFLIPRVLGVVATVGRRWNEAEAHFQAAIFAAASMGAWPELGRTYLDYARMLAARRGTGDRPRAIQLLRQAAPILLELGMEPFARRAAQLAEALRVHISPPSQPPAAYPDNLNEREVAVLLKIAQGRTDQEIAADLVLSSKTIVRHIGSLFAKIGVSGQSTAAAYASEKELAPQTRPERRLETSGERDLIIGEKAQPLRIILVTDMEGSGSLIQRWGDVQAHELLRLHNTIIRDCLRTHHGAEVTHTGDGIEASFPSASSAVACAVAIQKAFARHNQDDPSRPICVRIGINAGEPISTEGRLFGTAVHTAFRICARARPRQILVSDVIRQLVAGKDFAFVNHGRVGLKGLPRRVSLYEVQWESKYLKA
jgi:class 3 adenylate cyclase/tetratricopeptide (TPR) repeat protein